MAPIKLLLLLLLSVNSCYADDVLLQINRQLIKSSITQGNFQQEKRLKFLTKPLLSKGEFTYHQSKGVIWKTHSPLQTTMVITDSIMLTGDGKQFVPPAFGSVFKALLGGNMEILNQSFAVTGEVQSPLWTLQLKPKDELLKKVINTINITGDNEIHDWELLEAAGNVTRIHFSDISHPDRLNSRQQTDFESISP
jgi:outer membrane lipoprotein-sorting protein